MTNIKNCEHCTTPTSIERTDCLQPLEGNVCSKCGDWVCDSCTDYANSYKNGQDFICKQCTIKP